MTEPLARLYDLALRSLDDQERRADALRGRLGPVLAAAALGASLLSGPVIGGQAPRTPGGKLAIACALVGLAVMLVGARSVLTVRTAPLDEDVRGLADDLSREGVLDDTDRFYDAMIMLLTRHGALATRTLDHAERTFTAMVCGILVMLCGLAVAALVG